MSEKKLKSGASILVVDDEKLFRDVLCAKLVDNGFQTESAINGIEAINKIQRQQYDVILLDIKMPRVDGIEVLKHINENTLGSEVIMLTTFTDVRTAVETVKLGAYDYVTKPYDLSELLQTIDRALEHRKLKMENVYLKSELDRRQQAKNVVGNSPAFEQILETVYKVAPTDSNLLIQGPSGSGKEVIANLTFKMSNRKDKPFVALDCASIPENLLESELFGHEKGAFTDAQALKHGMVEVANNGTLFLDEIGEINMTIQPKLLRFIQTGEFRRIGGTQTMKANCRIIAATNRNLKDAVKDGAFREDLLFRLNVITLTLPSLSERKDDIPELVEHFIVTKSRGKEPKKVAEDALEKLQSYHWPGNVRELENVIERAIILTSNEVIDAGDIVLDYASTSEVEGVSGSELAKMSLSDIERIHIERVLKDCNFSKKDAAEVLGISLRTLYTKIYDYQIPVPGGRARSKKDDEE
ncbi:MAG: sigma-54-dependent Fis family transcriptional regulator [Ectothiorhodospiraceae bacterium]|nr:sigma-54-dependent Fis family transcriptional regulator [Ectothiorhodospiraceae bacterium]